MAKIILYSAVSIDGYIAKSNGAVDWLDGYDEEETDYGYSEFYHCIDTILMGKNTYQQVLSFDMEYPYADKESFVFSTSLSSAATPNTRIIKENYIEFTKKLKKHLG